MAAQENGWIAIWKVLAKSYEDASKGHQEFSDQGLVKVSSGQLWKSSVFSVYKRKFVGFPISISFWQFFIELLLLTFLTFRWSQMYVGTDINKY